MMAAIRLARATTGIAKAKSASCPAITSRRNAARYIITPIIYKVPRKCHIVHIDIIGRLRNKYIVLDKTVVELLVLYCLSLSIKAATGRHGINRVQKREIIGIADEELCVRAVEPHVSNIINGRVRAALEVECTIEIAGLGKASLIP